jgi:hypothetical protein
MKPTEGTRAEFFLQGFRFALATPDEARRWAFDIIEHDSVPPIWAIDVAMSVEGHSLEESLRAVPGERDRVVAGRLLLGAEALRLKRDELNLEDAALRAIHIYRALISDDYGSTFGSPYENLLYAQERGRDDEVGECKCALEAVLASEGMVVNE